MVCEVVCTLGLGTSDAASGHAVGNVELVVGLLLLGHRVELVSGTEVDSGTKVEFLQWPYITFLTKRREPFIYSN